MSALTYEAAVMLAEYIHAYVRPEWDKQGIVHALGNAKEMGDAGQVAVAAIVAAQNPRNRTPAVIPLAGPHWPASGAPAVRRAPPRNQTCGVCYLGEEECRRRWHWDHKFESVAALRERRIAEAEGVPDHVKAVRRRVQTPIVNGRPVQDVELP